MRSSTVRNSSRTHGNTARVQPSPPRGGSARIGNSTTSTGSRVPPQLPTQGLNTTTGSMNHQSRTVVTPAAVTASASASSSAFGRGKPPSNKPKTSSTEAVYTNHSRAMTVDKQIVDELLLVCGVIGTTTKVPSHTSNGDNDDDTNNHFTIVPVTDCVQWLQDLQRCLRRDDDVTRPISLLLHSWNIVVQKLLPLVHHTQYDTTLIITICKIIVLLTKPLHAQTIQAGRMMIHTKPSSSHHITEA